MEENGAEAIDTRSIIIICWRRKNKLQKERERDEIEKEKKKKKYNIKIIK